MPSHAWVITISCIPFRICSSTPSWTISFWIISFLSSAPLTNVTPILLAPKFCHSLLGCFWLSSLLAFTPSSIVYRTQALVLSPHLLSSSCSSTNILTPSPCLRLIRSRLLLHGPLTWFFLPSVSPRLSLPVLSLWPLHSSVWWLSQP